MSVVSQALQVMYIGVPTMFIVIGLFICMIYLLFKVFPDKEAK